MGGSGSIVPDRYAFSIALIVTVSHLLDDPSLSCLCFGAAVLRSIGDRGTAMTVAFIVPSCFLLSLRPEKGRPRVRLCVHREHPAGTCRWAPPRGGRSNVSVLSQLTQYGYDRCDFRIIQFFVMDYHVGGIIGVRKLCISHIASHDHIGGLLCLR